MILFQLARWTRHKRSLTSPSPYNHLALIPHQVFDRSVKRLQKDRAAWRDGSERSRMVDYVRDEVADRMMERLLVRVACLPFVMLALSSG